MSDQDQQPEPSSTDEKPESGSFPIPGRRRFASQPVAIGFAESEKAADQWSEDGRWRRWP
jgi:hypothetical protein